MQDIIERNFSFGSDGWGGMFSQLIAWVNFKCPHCSKYHSNSFLFDLEKDKTEYIGLCCCCNGKLKIKISKEQNNEIIKQQEENLKSIERKGNVGLEKWLNK